MIAASSSWLAAPARRSRRCGSPSTSPALDAVLFMESRSSDVDIAQAVGRAMRKAKGKDHGYIVLPVAVPAGVDPADALNDNERFENVWAVLRALRSHDDRFDAEINQMDLNKSPAKRVIFHGGQNERLAPLPFPPLDLPAGAIFAKIVEKCGDRKHWETWAKDVADIYSRLLVRIGGLLANPHNAALSEWFDAFLSELQSSINESITRANAIDMMAQHIITRLVFEALFEHYDFASGNPVARALDNLSADFGEFELDNEVRDLERFYESVRLRARGLDNAEARQRVLMELYEKFFATAMKKDADRLGIVYTPVEIVDFILNSADHALREAFGRGLADEGVHVLDPFTGTGIFLARLLQSALIGDGDLARKHAHELHANEIVLLACYIAAVHIEEACRGRAGGDYEPFGGIVLTDTFNLTTQRSFPTLWLPDNSERAELHLNYETCEEYPLQLEFPGGAEPAPEQYRLTTRKMKLTGGGTILVINEHVHLTGIPPQAHDYEVNGRSPLGWFIDRYHIKTDTRSGITNDPNGWFDDPRDLISAIRRIVHVSVETVRIVEALPPPPSRLARKISHSPDASAETFL